MRSKRRYYLISVMILLTAIGFSTCCDSCLSIILSVILIVILFGFYPLIMCIYKKRLPVVMGNVVDIENGWFPGRKVAVIKFAFNDKITVIRESYNEEDAPNIGKELPIIVDKENMEDSIVDEMVTNNTSANIVISVIVIGILLYKYFVK